MSGYVHVYTGNGKGKTTAALGLALRAAGAGLKTYIAQFAKGMDSSEFNSIKRFSDLIILRQFGTDRFITDKPTTDDISLAAGGLRQVAAALASGSYNIVILDEINIAVHLGLLDVSDLLELIDSKPDEVELIITGRYAHPQIISRADLVTEMREIKHYYSQGVLARTGIEN